MGSINSGFNNTMTHRESNARKHAMNLIENDESLMNFDSKGYSARSISPSVGGLTQRSHRAKGERITDLQIYSVDQACNNIHSYNHLIAQYSKYSSQLGQDESTFVIALQPNESQRLRFSVISLTVHILSRKFEKQARVEFLQRTVTINGLLEIFLFFNFSSDALLRRLCGSFLYYLIADSKELAKYIFDKVTKKIMTSSGDVPAPHIVYVNQPQQILQISHVTLNCTMPDEVLDRFLDDSDYFKNVHQRVNRCILEEKDGKVNAKKLNSRIFWFEPQVEKFEEFSAFTLPDLAGMDIRRLENIVNHYLVDFPDP